MGMAATSGIVTPPLQYNYAISNQFFDRLLAMHYNKFKSSRKIKYNYIRKPGAAMLKFLKAQFPNSQKHYDYICEIEDIKKGDKVFVMTRDGKKFLTVRGIFYSELEDMPLPAYAYKNVLGKYDSVFVYDWDNEYVYDEPYSSKEDRLK